jgi:large subunit ribosomal protein L23
MDVYQVIKKPVVSEKTHRLMSENIAEGKRLNQYTFEVDKRATKTQIKAAVEQLFEVKVAAVNTMMVRGKAKRVGISPMGRTRGWKKAVVTLEQDSSIQMY